jgi:hypothetical protein
MKKLLYILLIVTVLFSCQKEIEFDLPAVEQTLVIEATVENGFPPRVFLTKSQGYFDPYSSASLEDMFIDDAEVYLNDGSNTFELNPFTLDSGGVEFTVYTNLSAFGEFGKNYTLSVYHQGDTATAKAQIPNPVEIDSLWFSAYEAYDSLGLIWANFEDPDTVGNCYRWFAKRINNYRYNYYSDDGVLLHDVKDKQKDSRFIPPIGSSTDDKLFNGLKFDFVLPRGEDGVLEGPDDEGVEEAFFKRGDTVVIKSTSTTYPVYLYVRAMENAAVSNGSIFSSSGNLPYNVEGDGIGMFYGYGATYDTVICE